MFTDYQTAVIDDYQKKKVIGDLALNLANPTAAKLKDEWLQVLEEDDILKYDHALLRDFFGPKEDPSAFKRVIKTDGADRCRPLLKFLNGKTDDPQERIIELLAWLIKFAPRPYSRWQQDHSTNIKIIEEREIKKEVEKAGPIGSFREEEVKKNSSEGEQEVRKSDHPQKSQEIKKSYWKSLQTKHKYGLVSAFILVILSVSIAALGGWITVFHHEECMYWKGNHFESIACDQQTSNINAIALDQDRLDHFQKITRIDTLKENCIGKIWYSKINKEVAFFTSSGMHPTHIDKGLKIVTQHIYDTYIAKKKPTEVPINVD